MNYNINLDEKVYNNAEKILSNEGLDNSTAINMFLKKVVKENSIAFLFEQPNFNYSEDLELKRPAKMTKNIAKRLFLEQGFEISPNCNFASENQNSHNFWANPPFTVLLSDWFLILNNKTKRELYLFIIPENSISKYNLAKRADMPNVADIQIAYNDPTFTDNRSGVSFKKYLKGTIEY